MAYVQHTKCVEVKDHTGRTPQVLLGLAALATLYATGLSPYSLVATLVAIIAYCHWWLYDRLICLGGERCAIGLLGNVEPPEKKSFPDSLDTDYSINLILAPHRIQELPPDYPASVPPPPAGTTNTKEYFEKKFKEALHRQIADDGIQGHLIKEQSTTADPKTIFGAKSYPFQGYFSTVGGSAVLHHFQPYLHCEFEGGGVYKLYEAAKVALVFATIAAVVCAIPVFGWIACAVLAAIAVIISLAGLFTGLNDKGKPSVYDPATGKTLAELHNLTDILFVLGDWVFDTAHEGWNEIHPIKDCRLVARAKYLKNDVVDWDAAIASYMVAIGQWQIDSTDPKNPKLIKTSGPPSAGDWTGWVEAWCKCVRDANSPLTVAAQGRPENQWRTHPEVDGCRPR